MNKSIIEIKKPEPQPNSDMKLIVPTSSPTIGNTPVGRSSVENHELEYSIWSTKVTWCPKCKEHFYYEGTRDFHTINKLR